MPPGPGGAPAPALCGLGVDAEAVARFARHAAGTGRRTSVWTRRELDHAAAGPDPAASLCASFCCKEAVYKAAGGGVRFAAVELLARPPFPATLTAGLAAGAVPLPAVEGALVRVAAGPGGELVVIAALHAGPRPAPAAWPWPVALERIALADAAAGLDALLARDFAASERRALAGRPAASVLGRLAAKRAILRALGPAAAGASPADLVIERPPGGPPHLAAGAPAGAVLFSISHSRAAAYAAAAPAGCAPGAPGVQSVA